MCAAAAVASAALLVLLLFGSAAAARPQPAPQPAQGPLHAGYVPLITKPGSSLYYAYWEAKAPPPSNTDIPIVLWLQGGPGCASTFGAFYELGPAVVSAPQVPGQLPQLQPNAFSWNSHMALLVIDQPIGTGYSIAGSKDDIPTDMLGMATDLYEGLHGFFELNSDLQHRPLFITGESYAGKYIPSIAHYIVQAAEWHGSRAGPDTSSLELPQQHPASSIRRLRHKRALPSSVPPPNFNLTGITIGNGLTDPLAQTLVFPAVVYNMGLLTEAGRRHLQDQAEIVVQLVQAEQWPEAVQMRDKLLQLAANLTGAETLFDIRRYKQYDDKKLVDLLLNAPETKSWLNADPQVVYSSCSEAVMEVLAADTMKSSKHLLEDLLSVLPVLLYQGQFDVQDGVASSSSWILNLDWDYKREFAALLGEIWQVEGRPAGWKRSVATLTQVMLRNAGHMVPRDQPQAALSMLEDWVQGVLEQDQQQQQHDPQQHQQQV